MTADKGLSLYTNLDLDEADNAAEIQRIYQQWAARYDQDNDEALGTVSQPTMVELFGHYAPHPQMTLLDVGCGTGLVGHYLGEAGFTHFDGTDLSDDMLAYAAPRGYRTLFPANLSKGLPVADDAYDGCLCVGVFTHGHVGPEGLTELTRITRFGGLIGFTINEDVLEAYGFDKAIARFVEGGHWRLKCHQISDYMVKKDVKGIYVIAEVTDAAMQGA